MDWKLDVVSLSKTTYQNYKIFTEDRAQKSLSATDQIKKSTLNVATRYNTGFLLNYSGF